MKKKEIREILYKLLIEGDQFEENMAKYNATLKSMTKEQEVVLTLMIKNEDALKKIKIYKKEIKELERQQNFYTQSYKAGNMSLIEYTKQMSVSSIEVMKKKKAISSLNNEMASNIKTINSLETAVYKLTTKQVKLETQYKSMDEQMRNSDAGKKLRTEIEKNGKALEKETKQLAFYKESMGSFEETILKGVGINDKFAKSLITMSKDKGLDGFFKNVGTSVQAFGKTLMGLMTNPAFLIIAGVTGAVKAFQFWYDYNKGLVEASKLTTQFTGKAGDEMRMFRSEIQGTAETFGKDFKTVLESSSEVANQFGISQDAALKLVQDGFIAGADENGKFLEKLKSSSEEFTNAGFSAEEFISIISQTADSGFFSEKGFAAIKTAGEKIDVMSAKTRAALNGIGIDGDKVRADLLSGAITSTDVIRQVSFVLGELPEESKEAEIAIAEVFGESGQKAGREYIETLKDIDLNLDSNKMKAGELGDIQERQMNAQIELDATMAAMFDQTGGAFEEMTANAKLFLAEGLTKIAKGFVDVINWTIDLYNRTIAFRVVINGLIAYWTTLYNLLSHAFNLIIGNLKVVGKLIDAVFSASPTKFIEALSDYVDNTKTEIIGMAKDIEDAVSDAIDKTVNNKEIKKIEIPAVVVTETLAEVDKQAEADRIKKEREARERERKRKAEASDAAERRKKALDAQRQYEDSVTNLMAEGIEKQRKQTETAYDRQIQDLDAQLAKHKNKETAAAKTLANNIEILKKQKDADLRQLEADNLEKTAKETKSRLEKRLSYLEANSQEAFDLRVLMLEQEKLEEIRIAEETGIEVALIEKKYADEKQRLIDEQAKVKADAAQKLVDEEKAALEKRIADLVASGQTQNEAELVILKEKLATMAQAENEGDDEFLMRKNQMNADIESKEAAIAGEKRERIRKELGVYADMFDSIGEMMEEFGANSAALGAFSKALTLYDIGLNTAKALSSGVASAQSVPFPGNLLAVATTITTITTIMTNISKAKKALSSEKAPKAPKFAMGGLVTGDGSGTSDSITARLSNGESVITALGTQMFGPMLSAFNQIGGGAPIPLNSGAQQVQGKEMLTAAFREAMQSMPNPVVSVQEINNTNKRVEVLETYGVL